MPGAQLPHFLQQCVTALRVGTLKLIQNPRCRSGPNAASAIVASVQGVLDAQLRVLALMEGKARFRNCAVLRNGDNVLVPLKSPRVVAEEALQEDRDGVGVVRAPADQLMVRVVLDRDPVTFCLDLPRCAGGGPSSPASTAAGLNDVVGEARQHRWLRVLEVVHDQEAEGERIQGAW